jgi:uncharacterized protein YqgC (DUF456 family)
VNTKDVLLWVLAIVLVILGLVGTIAPCLPGVLLIFGGMLLAAWIDDFTRVGWPTLTLLGVLMVLTFAADILSSVLGARRVGASREALYGSVIGGLLGIPLGLPGLIAGPFVGAVIGELVAQRGVRVAARVGFGTWIGLLLGTLAKIALAVAMLGVFVAGFLL